MSTHSYSAPCPNCDGVMGMTTDTRPYERAYGDCSNCGFQVYPHESYMSLDDLNLMRADMELPPLDRLPAQNYSV